MRVRIFHNNARDEQGRHPAWERGFLAGDTVTEVFGYDVPVDELQPFTVEGVYDLFNIGDDPNYGEPDARALDYRAAGNRSFSKGDVVAVEDAGHPTLWFACASSGWDQIDPPTIENVADHGTAPIQPAEQPEEAAEPSPSPVRLTTTGHYPPYTWGNGEEILSPSKLTANVYRTDGARGRWTIRLFGADLTESYVHEDLWSLHMVRAVLARVDVAYVKFWAKRRADAEKHHQPLRKIEGWYWRHVIEEMVHAAWLEAADLEIARIGAAT